MEEKERQKQKAKGRMEMKNQASQKRRTLLKSMLGFPVVGVFAYEAFKKWKFDTHKKKNVIESLGLENLNAPVPVKVIPAKPGDLLRIGIIGFGTRGNQLANGLGFMHPSDVEKMEKNNSLQGWLDQEYLNVALVGICDVFDLHAEIGLATAKNEIRPGGSQGIKIPAKRYLRYQEMLADKDIDAVIIATPDHHHARMTIDAIKAGKHVYCEKSVALTEEELNEVYHTVRNSNKVFQLGHQITQNVVFQKAKEIIKKDILGKITLIETTSNRNSASGAWIRHLDANGNLKPGDEKSIDWLQWLGPCPYVPFSVERFYSWTKWFDYDTGMIGQLFTHEFDAVNQLLRIGIPKSVVSSGGIYFWKDNRDIPDTLHCVFEYPDKDLTLTFSGSLASNRERGRVFMGHDASMELGDSLNIRADYDSTRYKQKIEDGTIDTSIPMISVSPGSGNVDAITSASAKYYASRGLTTTNINGKQVDVTHLHLKEWLDCIRYGGVPSANIERAFEEGVACLMAHQSYIKKRRVEWDPVYRKIV
jgi:predicted dehydrogenase